MCVFPRKTVSVFSVFSNVFLIAGLLDAIPREAENYRYMQNFYVCFYAPEICGRNPVSWAILLLREQMHLCEEEDFCHVLSLFPAQWGRVLCESRAKAERWDPSSPV